MDYRLKHRRRRNEDEFGKYDPNASRPPIVIPKEFARDRGMRALIMAWVNLHERYRVLDKRLNWYSYKASEREKKKRRQKWIVLARILAIEHDMIRLIAKATHHPDIWMSKKLGRPISRRVWLMRRYLENRRVTVGLTGAERTKWMKFREKRVAEIRALDREWMLAMLQAMHPESVIPAPIKRHPRELHPRKLTKARELLAKDAGFR